MHLSQNTILILKNRTDALVTLWSCSGPFLFMRLAAPARARRHDMFAGYRRGNRMVEKKISETESDGGKI